MSDNNQALSGNTITPIQRVSLNSALTNLVLDSDSGNSSLIVRTGLIPSLYIDKYSNVGINTTSPGSQFEIVSNNGSCLRLRYGISTTSFTNMFMSSSGNLSINPNTAGSEINTTVSLNLVNHNGASIGLKLGGVLVSATASQLNYTAVVPGTASASKALVLNASSSISGINSVSATTLTGTLQTAAQPNITSVGSLTSLIVSGSLTVDGSFNLNGGGSIGDSVALLSGVTAGTATASKALVIDASKSISGINSLGLTSITVGGSVITSTEAGFIAGVSAGTAANSKALVLNNSGTISGIIALSATNLTGTLQTEAQPNITSIGTLNSLTIGSSTIGLTESAYIVGVTAGTASNSKVLVLNSSGAISGITSLSATSLTGTLQTAAQANITSVGTLSSLNVSGSTTMASTTDASGSTSGGALTVSGGLAVAKNAYIGANLTISGNLFVNGTTTTVSSSTVSIQDNTLMLNASPVGPVDSGIIVNRYQTPNDASTGSVIADTPSATTTSTSSTTTVVVIAAGSSVDNYYQGWWLKSGSQIRKVLSYVGSTKTITLESALTTALTNGSSISLFNRSYASMVWTETDKQFLAAYTATDSSSTLAIIDKADFGAAKITASGRMSALDTTDSSSTSTGSLITSGGVGIAKSLYVGTGIYGSIQTAAQPNITSLGTLSSLSVSGGVSASTLTGTLQTATQSNITSVGTLSSLSVSSTTPNVLTLTNSSATSNANLKMIGDSYSCEIGVRGTSASINPSTLYVYYNDSYRLLMDTSGNIAIGTTSFGYKLNVSGSFNATSINIGGVALATNLISGTIAAGTAIGGKVLSVDSSLNITGINSLTATTLVLGSSSLGATEAGYLTSIAAGTASLSKALVLDASKNIAGINSLSATTLTGTLQTAAQPNMTSVGTLTGLTSSGVVSITNSTSSSTTTNGALIVSGGVGIGGSLNVLGSIASGGISISSITDATSSANGGAMTCAGGGAFAKSLFVGTTLTATTLAGTLSTAAQPNITSVGTLSSLSTGSITLNGTVIGATAAELNYLDLTTGAGVAEVSKALVLNSSGNISGINSLSATTLIVNGIDVYASMYSSDYLTGITEGTATASKAVVLNASKSITGINSLTATTLVLGTTSLTTTEAAYLTSITAGTAANSKALVLNSSGAISGISSLSTTTLVLGSTSLGATEAAYLTSITAGTASASKALVLNSNRNIANLGALSSIFINDTTSILPLQTWTNDLPVDNLIVKLDMSNAAPRFGSTSNHPMRFMANNVASMYLQASGNVSIGGDVDTYKLGVNGSLNATSYYLNDSILDFASISYVSSITPGTAANSKALVLNSSGAITGITSLSTTTLVLGANSLGATEAAYLTSNAAGTATASKAVVLDASKSITGVNSLTATTLVLGTTSLTTTEAAYLTSNTAGTAVAGKALILDSSKNITGLGSMSLTGANDLLSLTNTTASGYVAQTFVSDSYSLTLGVRGSTNATNPNVAYMYYNGTYRLVMNSSGEVSLGTNTFGYKLNVSGSVNATSYYLNGSVLDLSGLSYISTITPGTAANSKALVLNSSGAVSGITSLSATTIVVNGSSISSEAAFIAGVTAGTAANSKALVLNSSGAITGITSLSATTIVLGSSSLGAAEAAYLTSNVAGTATASKAVVLDASKSITGVNSLTATTLVLGTTSLTTTQAAYLTSITAGTALASKALVLDASKNITGLNSIGLTSDGSPISMTNTTTTARTTIQFVNDTKSYELGTAGSANTTYPTNSFYLYDATSAAVRLMVNSAGNVAIGATSLTDKLYVNGSFKTSGAVNIADATVSSSTTTGALKVAGGVGIVGATNIGGALNVTGTITGTLATAAQPNITSIGTLTSLSTGNITLGGTLITASATKLNYNDITTIGTAQASKALVLDASRNITNIGSLTTTGDITTTGNLFATKFETTSQITTTVVKSTKGSSTLVLGHTLNLDAWIGTITAHNFSIITNNAFRLTINGTTGAITGISSLTATSLTGTLQTAAQPNITSVGTLTSLSTASLTLNGTTITATAAKINYLDITTIGTAEASKALVVDAGRNITNINSLTATSLTGTLQTAAQTAITSVGTLTSLTTTGAITSTLSTVSTSNSTGAVKLSGGLSISNTTDATSSTNGGTITSAGGGAFAKSLYVGQNLTVGGNLTVSGTTTTINSSIVSITDNLISLNSGPADTGYDAGILTRRYQVDNSAGTGDVVNDTAEEVNTLTAATSTTITVSVAALVTDYYKNWWIKITSGTAINQVRQVTAYNGTTKVYTLSTPFTTTPSAGASVSLYNKPYSAMIWQEAYSRFATAYSITDTSGSVLNIADYAPLASDSLTLLSTTDATSSTDGGAMTCAGGGAFAKSLYVGGNISLTGGISVNGSAFLDGSRMLQNITAMGMSDALGSTRLFHTSNGIHGNWSGVALPTTFGNAPYSLWSTNVGDAECGLIGINGNTIIMSTPMDMDAIRYYDEDTRGLAFSISANGTITAGSDERLKTNINILQWNNILDKIKLLHPYTYAYKKPETCNRDTNKYDRIHKGFIAQNVYTTFPELVNIPENYNFEEDDGENYMSVEMNGFILPLIQCVQELTVKIEESEQNIIQLNEKNTNLTSQIEAQNTTITDILLRLSNLEN